MIIALLAGFLVSVIVTFLIMLLIISGIIQTMISHKMTGAEKSKPSKTRIILMGDV